MVHAAVYVCEEAGAKDCRAFSMTHLNSPTDYMILCSSDSTLHTQGINRKVIAWLASQDIEVINPYNRNDTSGWIVIDCGFMFIHIMLREVRAYYDLEHLWLRDQLLFDTVKEQV